MYFTLSSGALQSQHTVTVTTVHRHVFLSDHSPSAPKTFSDWFPWRAPQNPSLTSLKLRSFQEDCCTWGWSGISEGAGGPDTRSEVVEAHRAGSCSTLLTLAPTAVDLLPSWRSSFNAAHAWSFPSEFVHISDLGSAHRGPPSVFCLQSTEPVHYMSTETRVLKNS